jgi:hypothetical protein
MDDLKYHPCSRDQRVTQRDARGFLCFTCDTCYKAKMSRYRLDVLNDPNYWADEAIEEDY